MAKKKWTKAKTPEPEQEVVPVKHKSIRDRQKKLYGKDK